MFWQFHLTIFQVGQQELAARQCVIRFVVKLIPDVDKTLNLLHSFSQVLQQDAYYKNKCWLLYARGRAQTSILKIWGIFQNLVRFCEYIIASFVVSGGWWCSYIKFKSLKKWAFFTCIRRSLFDFSSHGTWPIADKPSLWCTRIWSSLSSGRLRSSSRFGGSWQSWQKSPLTWIALICTSWVSL